MGWAVIRIPGELRQRIIKPAPRVLSTLEVTAFYVEVPTHAFEHLAANRQSVNGGPFSTKFFLPVLALNQS